jgi:DNA-directed RNA polymerases I, II, and III subunit RPABC1
MDFQDKINLYKVRNTIIEMIEDRGYHVPNIEKIGIEEFIIKYNNKLLDIYIEDNDIKIYVHFHNDVKNFSKNDLKNLMKKITNDYEENINVILLLREKENSAVTKELSKEIYKNVEVFLKKNMMFNITHHEYVPKHSILSKEEEKDLLEKYNLTTSKKLPKISKEDPVAKYYGMKTDQICKIIRKSPEVGTYIYYRLVR